MPRKSTTAVAHIETTVMVCPTVTEGDPTTFRIATSRGDCQRVLATRNKGLTLPQSTRGPPARRLTITPERQKPKPIVLKRRAGLLQWLLSKNAAMTQGRHEPRQSIHSDVHGFTHSSPDSDALLEPPRAAMS